MCIFSHSIFWTSKFRDFWVIFQGSPSRSFEKFTILNICSVNILHTRQREVMAVSLASIRAGIDKVPVTRGFASGQVLSASPRGGAGSWIKMCMKRARGAKRSVIESGQIGSESRPT